MRLQRLAFILGMTSLSLGCALNRNAAKPAPKDPDAAILMVRNGSYSSVRLYVCQGMGCRVNQDINNIVGMPTPFPITQHHMPLSGRYIGDVSNVGTYEFFVIPREFISGSYWPRIFIAMNAVGEYFVTDELPIQRGDTLDLRIEDPLDHTSWMINRRS